jgi:Ras-related protein Rab-40
MGTAAQALTPSMHRVSKPYDFLLKFLLVGDSDVGKEEILNVLTDGASESPYGYSSG